MNEKQCKGPCGKTKPLTEFYRDKNKPDGHRSSCIECDKERQRKYRANQQPSLIQYEPQQSGEKLCACCGQMFPVSDFCKHRKSPTGLQPWCKQHHKRYDVMFGETMAEIKKKRLQIEQLNEEIIAMDAERDVRWEADLPNRQEPSSPEPPRPTEAPTLAASEDPMVGELRAGLHLLSELVAKWQERTGNASCS